MQRVKGHGNPGGVRNGSETNEHENVNNWTHRVWPISNYYGTSYPYATFCVGDATGNAWPNNEQITYVGNYNGQLGPDAAAYGMEGVYNPPAGTSYAAPYGQAAPNNGSYNYYPAATQDYSAAAAAAAAAAGAVPPPWNPTTAKAYENYYEDPLAAATLKTIDQRLQNLDMADANSNKLYSTEKKTTTWASIAKQPAKPMPQASSGGSKKKGPGMPPPPMVPGRHNIDLNPWETKASSMAAKAPVIQAPPPPTTKTVWNGPLVTELPPPLPPTCDLMAPPPPQPHFDVSAPPPALPRKMFPVTTLPPPSVTTPSTTLSSSSSSSPPPSATSQLSLPPPNPPAPSVAAASVPVSASSTTASAAPPLSAHQQQQPQSQPLPQPTPPVTTTTAAAAANSITCSASSSLSSSSCSSTSSSSSSSSLSARSPPHSVVDKLRDKNNYNPRELELPPKGTRFFVIKSYSEDDVHRSIKYEIWCSTERGNKRLDDAYADQKTMDGAVYLFFSVNGSGHFCGVARMCSPVDYGASSSVWAQDKWKGQFGVRWIYVKDVPNSQLRHIRLENNENKPVTNSRDTQEVPYDKGVNVLKLIHAYPHTTSIFDDFTHYEKRQEEGDSSKRGNGGGQHQSAMQAHHNMPAPRPNPFASRGSLLLKDREGGGGSSFSQMNQNRRGGRNNNNSNGNSGFTNHRSNHSNMLRS